MSKPTTNSSGRLAFGSLSILLIVAGAIGLGWALGDCLFRWQFSTAYRHFLWRARVTATQRPADGDLPRRDRVVLPEAAQATMGPRRSASIGRDHCTAGRRSTSD